MVVVGLVLTFSLATVAWIEIKSSQRPVSDPRIVPLTSNLDGKATLLFSRRGRIAYVWDGGDGKSTAVYVKLIGAGDPVRLTGKEDGAFSPAWSPDGVGSPCFETSGRNGSVNSPCIWGALTRADTSG